jgi:hypothetical protein
MYLRATMHDSMPDDDWVKVLRFAQPNSCHSQGNVGHIFWRISLVDKVHPIIDSRVFD